MSSAERAFEAIQRFLTDAREPALLEAGLEPIRLVSGFYDIDLRNGRLTLHAWDEKHSIARRIVDVGCVGSGKLELCVERFGKQAGTLELLDLARPRQHRASRRAGQLQYRERFRRSLLRQFPGAALKSLSTSPDLENGLSSAYPRALVVRGTSAWAALGIPPEHLDPDGALSFGLVWLDYVRRREPSLNVGGLAIFVPEGKHHNICLRLLHLSNKARWAVFVYGDGFEDAVDLKDFGNVETVLPIAGSSLPLPVHLEEIGKQPHVDTLRSPAGRVSWRVNGLEFASFDGADLTFGLETHTKGSASNVPEIVSLSRELALRRCPDAPTRSSPLYNRNPEAWLEARVRACITTIDASLLSSPVYGQVPALAASQRGVIDLLACDCAGRLAVVEVKVSEDLHLPLQALDYWIRVKWHLERGEFESRGFFPGVSLVNTPPRMLLIAPALSFHPTTETVLSFFPPDLQVERIGVAMDWRSCLSVAFRSTGTREPASQMWSGESTGSM